MRFAKMKLAKPLIVVLLVMASALWLFRDSLRVHYHLSVLRHAEQQVFAPQFITLRQEVMAVLLRRPNWQGWDAIRSQHEDALIRMGYFARREFPLTNQNINSVQLLTNAQLRFATQFSSLMVVTNGQRLDGTTVASNSFAAIIAPTAEMSKWSKLIFELDGDQL